MSADELIDSLHKEFENPTEWKRRRAFLQMNFNELPFDRLVCLSHCYVNSSLHGAVYPARVMDEVEQYSRNIDGYLSNGADPSGGPPGGGGDRSTAHRNKRAGGVAGADEVPPWKQQRPDAGKRRPRPLDLDAELLAAEDGLEGVSLPRDLDLGEFYLREIETDAEAATAANPANVLKCSTDFCRRTLDYQFEGDDGSVRCRLLLDGRTVAADTGASRAAAKAAVSVRVLAALRRRCWTLVVRSDRAFIRAQADAGFARPSVGGADESAGAGAAAAEAEGQKNGGSEAKIGSDNVGHRLLLGMGWSGAGGLGKRLDGRAEPVAGDVRVVSRAGLGAAADAAAAGAAAVGAAFQSAVGRVLRDFQRDQQDRDDLFFAADFSNEERRHVHSQCLRLGLASRSYGAADGARCLVVSRKRSARQLVEFVRRNGGSTVRYRLMAPGSACVGGGGGDGVGETPDDAPV